MTEDEYNKFLNKNFSCTMENRDRYDEIAENKCDHLKRIYLDGTPGLVFWSLTLIILIAVVICGLIISGKITTGLVTNNIQNVVGNIFTAFIALLGLLAVFFVFKTELQRNRVGGDMGTMTSLFHKDHEKRELKSIRSTSTTKEMVRCFHEKLRWGKEELREPWIHMVNQLYISHVNLDYFTRNLFLFIIVIILSLLLMTGLRYPSFLPFNVTGWNPVWFSLDIVLAFISIVYLFHTLMVMIKHVYLKEDLKRIHKSERGMWGPYETIGNYESHMEIKEAVGICPKCKGKKRLELKQVFNRGQGIGNNLLVLCSNCNTNKLTQEEMEGFISKRSGEVKEKIKEILEKEEQNFHF